MKHERDGYETVAAKVDARINHTAVPFAANHGAVLLHPIGDVYFTDFRQKHRAIETLSDIGDRGSRREICDYRPFLTSEHMKNREHERVVLADRLTAV